MVPHCGFDLHFSDKNDVQIILFGGKEKETLDLGNAYKCIREV